MITNYEQRKLQLELFYLKPGLNLPENAEAAEVTEVATQNEIKALKRANKRVQLQLASLKGRIEELDQYAHTVAHNLKDPLSVIILTSDAIGDIADLTAEEIRDYLQQIRATAYEMNDTIDNLLFFSEVRKVEVPSAPVDMGNIVLSVRKRLNHLVKEYQASVQIPDQWPAAIGYAPWIEEVWANYLSNAIKYGGRPPVVRLGSTVQQNGMLSFWVLDNGLGIPPEIQANLFAPFNQCRQNYRAGHGLGLSIVRHIVEKLGGKVGVESRAGQGSLFFFTLPASQISKVKPLEKNSTGEEKNLDYPELSSMYSDGQTVKGD